MRKEDVKRSLWDLAEVIEILPSVDGKARAVRLRTKNGECTRPLVKLHPLLTSKELRPDPPGETQEQESSEALPVAPDDPVAQPAPSAPPSLMTPPDDSPRMRPQRAARTAGRRRVQEI